MPIVYCITSPLPHVDMERFGFADFKPSRPGAVWYVHKSNTKELIVVIPGPVEHHTRA